MSRATYLLTKAAEALRDGRSPFDQSFLVEHNVTLDECFDLSNNVASAIDIVLALGEM